MVIFNSYVSHYQRVLSEKFGENLHSIYIHVSTYIHIQPEFSGYRYYRHTHVAEGAVLEKLHVPWTSYMVYFPEVGTAHPPINGVW